MRPGRVVNILKDILSIKKEQVEIYTKTSTSDTSWQATKKAAPGNMSDLDDLLGLDDSEQDAVVMAAKIINVRGQTVCGVAFGDKIMRTLDVCEFTDGDSFANFESILVQRSPKECLLFVTPSISPGDKRKILEALGRCDVPVTEQKSAVFATASLEQDLAHIVGPLEQHLSVLEKKEALGSLACIIKFLDLTNERESGNASNPDHSNFRNNPYRHICAECLRSLTVHAS
jgi:DNA mismatch repair ATPase MutS